MDKQNGKPSAADAFDVTGATSPPPAPPASKQDDTASVSRASKALRAPDSFDTSSGGKRGS